MLEAQLEYIRGITGFCPDAALILGSGLGGLADEIEIEAVINYGDIPGFPVSTAPSHKGRLVFGYMGSAKVIIMQGRVHLYEGYTSKQVANPVFIMKRLGAKTLFLTNAAGGINRNFSIGDFMLIEDHISSFVPSPLIGKNNEDLGPRFPDMSEVYSKRLNSIIAKTAIENGIDIKKGVYVQLSGPAFETKAEIKMCAALGADAVGMSTAIEAQAAKYCGFEVCGISCITNLACGLLDKPISSEEVTETADNVAPDFKKLIRKSIESINNGQYQI